MSWTGTKRVIKGGLTSFKRNGIVSLASVLVLTITLMVISLLIFSQAVLKNSLSELKNKVDVTIYFNIGTSEDKISSLKSSLENLPEVAAVDYVSAEESLKDFRAKHESDYPTIQALDEIGENPLEAYLNVKAKEISQYEGIANFLKSDNALALGSASYIDKVNYNQNKSVIEKLNNIIDGSQKLGLIVTLILVIISVIITFNTIRLAIYISREEIGIMRLVGAGKRYIRGPFMIEGAICGVIAAVLVIIVLYPASAWLGNNMSDFLGMNLLSFYASNFFKIFGLLLASGAALGTFSSYLAVSRYLNK